VNLNFSRFDCDRDNRSFPADVSYPVAQKLKDRESNPVIHYPEYLSCPVCVRSDRQGRFILCKCYGLPGGKTAFN